MDELFLLTNEGSLALNIIDDTFHILIEQSGNKTLTFNMSRYDENYKFIKNEMLLEFQNLYYRIKMNDDSNDEFAVVESVLDKNIFKSKSWRHFRTEEKNLHETISYAMSGIRYTIKGALEISGKKTIDMHAVDILDVITECANQWEIVYDFDNKNKVLTIVNPNQTLDKGFFIHEQVNLLSMQYKSDTYDFYTRAYFYGETDTESGKVVNFASINNGKEYIEDFSYSNQIIEKVIIDERFKNDKSLLEYAKKEIKKHAVPDITYSMNVVNLYDLDRETYYLLNFKVNDIVTLKDNTRGYDVIERILIHDWYPRRSDLDVITMSDKPLNITDITSSLLDKVNNIGTSLTDTKLSSLGLAKDYANKMLNIDGLNGHAVKTLNEFLVMDTDSKETAKKVLRINNAGLGGSTNGYNGPFNVAILTDGSIVADAITSGTLKSILIEGVDIKGSKVTGTTISNGLNFHVDANGNMQCTNAKVSGHIEAKSGTFSGDIKGSKVTGTTISNGLNFHVDANGNMQCTNAKVSGHIDAKSGTFSGDIKGGTISGSTAINVGTDLHVGDNIYLGDQKTTGKRIYGGNDTSIGFSWDERENYKFISLNLERYGMPNIMITENGARFGNKNLDSCYITPGGLSSVDSLLVNGNLTVSGTKNRVVQTELFGSVLMNSIESTFPAFEDFGTAQLNKNGKIVIRLKDKFLATVRADEEYYVFLTPSSKGNLYVKNKYKFAFVVCGTPNLSFDWRVVIKQKGFEDVWMNEFKKKR